jgi:hypothetical protein
LIATIPDEKIEKFSACVEQIASLLKP